MSRAGRTSLIQFVPALAIGLVSGVALLIAYHLPPERGEIGVIFPPWTAQTEALGAIVAAGGSIVSTGRFSNIVIAFSHEEGFSQRVTGFGAWFTTAARGLCTPALEVRS